MSTAYYYDLCTRCVNRSVSITNVHGKVYRGVIERVDREYVYLRPLDGHSGISGFGYGYGYGGYGRPGYGYSPYGYGYGYGRRIALASIAALILIPFLFI